ncbi:hypothetical protein BZA05DRAFT_51671 [Tricharina praecox]|uniref:uncharacterized protein n=1 Tax=Tricharina praecox TaxID=43433 RepID=UPI00221F77D9|nr:uncharacterized protein BZA05DRAFT_51671 [Tricharina praecox]KAI5850862.1 hypothetical protein BZA05DRAFT_51671 [Tricharina praecox]
MPSIPKLDDGRIYRNSMHSEFVGGEFHGGQTFVSDGSERSRRSEILEWISTIPYTSHHRSISDCRLDGTGTWIFDKDEYRTWRASNVSLLLLLRGIPGVGKTYIALTVVDYFLRTPLPGKSHTSIATEPRQIAETQRAS